MARALIAPASERAQELAELLRADGWTVSTAAGEGVGAIVERLEDVSVLVVLDGVVGEGQGVSPLEHLIRRVVDTPVRGVVVEVREGVTATVQASADLARIPIRILEGSASPGELRAAVPEVLGLS